MQSAAKANSMFQAEELDKTMPKDRRVRTRSFVEDDSGVTLMIREYVGDDMDLFLAKKGLMKKAVACDGSGIFRAVCEQISSVQTDHIELRRLVESILRPRAQSHMRKVMNGLAIGRFDRDTNILQIVTEITKSKVIVYRNVEEEPEVYAREDSTNDREMLLCACHCQYEPLYSIEMHESLAIAQAITYRMLYEGVFKEEKQTVDDAIVFIRNDIDDNNRKIDQSADNVQCNDMVSFTAQLKTPSFPFCACKSLDPAIYRNVEYDRYQRKRREQQEAKEIASFNSMIVKFGLGTKCLVRNKGEVKTATVTTMINPETRRISFEDGSGYRDLNVSDLRPLPILSVPHSLYSSNQQGLYVPNNTPISSPMSMPSPLPSSSIFGLNPFSPHPISAAVAAGCPLIMPIPPPSTSIPPPFPILPPLTAPPFTNRCHMFTFGIANGTGEGESVNFSESACVQPNELTWWKQNVNMDARGQRRATEGDVIGTPHRPLRRYHRMSTSTSMEDKMSSEYGDGLSPLPSLLPMSYNILYASSEWTDHDTVFSNDEGIGGGQIPMDRPTTPLPQSPFLSPCSVPNFTISVPHIGIADYEKVNKEALFSSVVDGNDLPDTLTTRFFYNLGIKFFRDNLQGQELNIYPSDETDCDVVAPSPTAVPLPMAFIDSNGAIVPASMTPGLMNNGMSVPSTPSVIPNLPPFLAQYVIPNVEGMPTYQELVANRVMSPGGWTPSNNEHVFFPPNGSPY